MDSSSGRAEMAVLSRELERLREENTRLSRLLIQCAGRVVRSLRGKVVAEVHDYHDVATPILAASLRRRMPGYRALGFEMASQ